MRSRALKPCAWACRTPTRARFWLGCSTTLVGLSAFASQTGPAFPTHRFPTDQSAHFSYQGARIGSSANFVDALSTDPLANKGEISFYRHEFTLEYQPSRKLNLGVIFSLLSASIVDNTTTSAKNSAPGDQFLFFEYRAYDKPGASVGGAFMLKFPGYSNPTYEEFKAANEGHTVLFGDGQTDITALLTGEYWPSKILRLRLDSGLTFRTEQYSAEVPIQAAFGIVTPQVELDLRFRGNLTLRTDQFDSASNGLDKLRAAFGNSAWAYSSNPWVFSINPSVEVWLSPKWALGFDYAYSLLGNRAPYYQSAALSLTYRWAKSVRKSTRTFHEVDIGTDQESGQFQGEIQGKELEPKAVRPERIREEPQDEVFE